MQTAQLRRFLERDPDNVAMACELAEALIAQSAADEAFAALGALPASGQAKPEVRFLQARCALVAGRYPDAAAGYASLLADGHDALGIHHDHVYALLCARSLDQASEALALAILRHGVRAELLVLKARIEAMRGACRDAVTSAEAALAIDPVNATAAGIMALALHDDGDHPAAEAVAEAALKLDPQQHEALLVSAAGMRRRGEIDAVGHAYERILSRHPRSARALAGYAETVLRRGDFAGAEALLHDAARYMPDHIGTWHALAWAQLLQGRHAAAEISYRHAYAIDRNFGDTHGGLALTAVLRGEHAAAEASIQRALRLDPRAMTARCAQALLADAQGDTVRANALLEAILNDAGGHEVPAREFAAAMKSLLTTRAG